MSSLESKETVKDVPVLNSDEWLEYIDNEKAGEEISLPLGLLPAIRGTVTAFGAETGVGKTAMGLQAFRWVGDQGRRCAYTTLEMSPALLFRRFAPQFDSEQDCKDWIKDTGVHVSRSYLDFPELEEIMRNEYEFLVIDHIHELPFDGHEDLARKVRRIGSLATETNTAVLMLAQVKQPDPMFPNAEPTLYDFSWTKAIPEVASIGYILWRPDPNLGTLKINNVKNRFGGQQEDSELSLDIKTVTFKKV